MSKEAKGHCQAAKQSSHKAAELTRRFSLQRRTIQELTNDGARNCAIYGRSFFYLFFIRLYSTLTFLMWSLRLSFVSVLSVCLLTEKQQHKKKFTEENFSCLLLFLLLLFCFFVCVFFCLLLLFCFASLYFGFVFTTLAVMCVTYFLPLQIRKVEELETWPAGTRPKTCHTIDRLGRKETCKEEALNHLH